MLAIFSVSISYAQTGDHSHASTHGGVVQEANDYHNEMVKSKDTLNFCLLGADDKASKNHLLEMKHHRCK